MIGLGSEIQDVAEFNRRAVIALRGVSFPPHSSGAAVAAEFQRQVASGTVSDKMQQAVYNIAHRFRRQITDTLVIEYATARARGYE